MMKSVLNAAVIASLMLAGPAVAKKDDHKHGHGKGHKEKHWDRGRDDDYDVNVVIINNDRSRLRNYIYEDYHSHCPPGLAKKHNGCLPPGQAKKRYVVGRALPSYVVYEPVPEYVLYDLEPVPVGYQYVRVDRDVLLINMASKKVIDAVTLLSAVGN